MVLRKYAIVHELHGNLILSLQKSISNLRVENEKKKKDPKMGTNIFMFKYFFWVFGTKVDFGTVGNKNKQEGKFKQELPSECNKVEAGN